MQDPTNQNSSSVDRRRFLSTMGAAAVAGGLGSLLPSEALGSMVGGSAEEAVKELHASLSDAQRKVVCLPFNHKSKRRISPNWHITEPTLDTDFYSDSQRELAQRVVKSLCSEDGYQRLLKQMDDDSGGIGDYSIAMFGDPSTKDFQWELTGRHLTLRADGARNDRMAFGGPIVYGHSEEEAKQNLFYYQTTQVNKVFAAMDGNQRKRAMMDKSPRETDVQIQGKGGRFRGISVAELSSDQKALVTDSLKVLLAPFRQEDIQEVMWILLENGGIDSLNMAFSKQGDLDNDKTWDVWRVEGPAFVWHFRGAPHVHAYINIGKTRRA